MGGSDVRGWAAMGRGALGVMRKYEERDAGREYTPKSQGFTLFCFVLLCETDSKRKNIQKGYINKRLCPGTGISEEMLVEYMKREKAKAKLGESALNENSLGVYPTFSLMQPNAKVTY